MKVRVNSYYYYNPNGWDRFDPKTTLKRGDRVKVVNARGCPKINMMGGHCFVEFDGKFAGLVSIGSLQKEEPEPLFKIMP